MQSVASISKTLGGSRRVRSRRVRSRRARNTRGRFLSSRKKGKHRGGFFGSSSTITGAPSPLQKTAVDAKAADAKAAAAAAKNTFFTTPKTLESATAWKDAADKAVVAMQAAVRDLFSKMSPARGMLRGLMQALVNRAQGEATALQNDALEAADWVRGGGQVRRNEIGGVTRVKTTWF